jgi:hypothetical protein
MGVDDTMIATPSGIERELKLTRFFTLATMQFAKNFGKQTKKPFHSSIHVHARVRAVSLLSCCVLC